MQHPVFKLYAHSRLSFPLLRVPSLRYDTCGGCCVFLPILCAGALVRELETDAAAAKKLSFAQPAAAAPTLFGAKPLRRDAAALPGEAAATAAASES